MQRHSSIRPIWLVLLALLLVNGWFALALMVPAQAHAAFMRTSAQGNFAPAHGNDQKPPQMNTATPTATASPTTTPTPKGNGNPCLSVQVGDTVSHCDANNERVTLTTTSLSQVTISGQYWPQDQQGTLMVCAAPVGSATCPNPILQMPVTVKKDGTFTQAISSLSFTSYNVVFHDPGNDNTPDVGITVTFTQGVSFALSASLGVAVLSLVVFVIAGGLSVGGRKPAGQGIQG